MSIHITHKGNRIRFTGKDANEMFKALTKPKETVSKNGQLVGSRCKACDCKVDEYGCGCNPNDA